MKSIKFLRIILSALVFSLASSFAFAQQPSVQPLTMLKEGNLRFCSNQLLHQHQDMARVSELNSGQQPFAVIIGCSDSRVSPEIIFDQGLGDLFSIRTAGNVMGDYEEGSIEYAVEHLHSKLVVVLGHTNCGAVKAFIDIEHGDNHNATEHAEELGHIKSIVDKLNSEEEEHEIFSTEGTDTYNRAIKANIIHGVKQLRNSDPILSKKYKEGEIQVIGALYHLDSGVVEFLDI